MSTGALKGYLDMLSFRVRLNIVMDKRSNNMWKENAFVFKFPTGLCSVIRKQIPEFYHVVFKRPRNDNTPCSLSPVSDLPRASLYSIPPECTRSVKLDQHTTAQLLEDNRQQLSHQRPTNNSLQPSCLYSAYYSTDTASRSLFVEL